jgi:hypothetical protein
VNDNIRIALITAAAGLLGGAVAGGTGVATTVLTQSSENERVEHRLDEEARGAARVLFSRFTVGIGAAEEVLYERRYVRDALTVFVTPVSAGDLKLITSRLSVAGFDDVDGALRAMASLFARLEKREGRRLQSYNSADIRVFKDAIEEGQFALRVVADLPLIRPRPAVSPERPPGA